MSKDRICAYGNCESKEVEVTVNIMGNGRPAFCCIAHAGLFLLKTEVKYGSDRSSRFRDLVIELERGIGQ